MNKNNLITPNFKYYEIFSGDKKLGKNSIEPPQEYLSNAINCVKQLQIVRDILNGRADLKERYLQYKLWQDREFKIQITSGYRTPDWNASKYVKGSKNSKHLKALATDSRCIGLPLFIYYSFLVKYTNFFHFGYYRLKNFVHAGFDDKLINFKF